MFAATLTDRSSNAKIGPISCVTVTNKTCPDACPLKRNGCYADYSHVGALWRKMSEALPGDSVPHGRASVKVHSFEAMLDWITNTATRLWRYGIAGDLPGEGDKIDAAALSRIVEANKGRMGFAYTHKPTTDKANRNAIEAANRDGLAVNVSTNSVDHADKVKASGIKAPVVTIVPADTLNNFKTPAGHQVVICPAVTQKLTCLECKLCARPNRKSIVAFPAHGAGKAKAEGIASC